VLKRSDRQQKASEQVPALKKPNQSLQRNAGNLPFCGSALSSA
jgi:hypothetical protein